MRHMHRLRPVIDIKERPGPYRRNEAPEVGAGAAPEKGALPSGG